MRIQALQTGTSLRSLIKCFFLKAALKLRIAPVDTIRYRSIGLRNNRVQRARKRRDALPRSNQGIGSISPSVAQPAQASRTKDEPLLHPDTKDGLGQSFDSKTSVCTEMCQTEHGTMYDKRRRAREREGRGIQEE